MTLSDSNNLVPEAASVSQSGQESGPNGDSFFADPPRGFYAIADGVGRSPESQMASSLAVHTLNSALPDLHSPWVDQALLETMKEGFQAANRALLALSRDDERPRQTTLTSVIIYKKRLYCAHCGDSRAYLIAGNTVRCLTEDHSIVGDMVRSHLLTESDAKKHPGRNILSSCLGLYEPCRVQAIACKPGAGQFLLLCTDGVWAYLSSTEITTILSLPLPVNVLAQQLVEQAYMNQSHDDRTLLLVKLRTDNRVENPILSTIT